MRRRIVYDLYDLEGNFIMRDNAIKLADYVGCEDSTIRDSASRKHVIGKKYIVKLTGEREEIIEAKKPEPEIDYSTNPYECMKMLLKAHGNTFVTFDPEPYFPRLREDGLECTYRIVKEYTTTNVSKRGRKPKPKYNYVVEVAN